MEKVLLLQKTGENNDILPVRIIINADKETDFKAVQKIIAVCSQNRIAGISFGPYKVDLPVDSGIMMMPGTGPKVIMFGIEFSEKNGSIGFKETSQGAANFEELERMLTQCQKDGQKMKVHIMCIGSIPYKYVLHVVKMSKQHGVEEVVFTMPVDQSIDF